MRQLKTMRPGMKFRHRGEPYIVITHGPLNVYGISLRSAMAETFNKNLEVIPIELHYNDIGKPNDIYNL